MRMSYWGKTDESSQNGILTLSWSGVWDAMSGMDQMLFVLSGTDSASPLNPNRVTPGPKAIG